MAPAPRPFPSAVSIGSIVSVVAPALLAIAFAAALTGCQGKGEIEGETRHPVLFVGLDGADWQLLDGYMADGVMPNLAALVAAGRSGVLTTIHPPLSPLVWTTMMTGVGPLQHGILDFTRFNPTSGEREPITAAERRVPAVWSMASAAHRRVALLGLWATWPAEAVDGLLVSDRLFSFQLPQAAPPPGIVHPAEREPWARKTLDAVERDVGFAALHAYLPWLDEAAYRLLATMPDPYRQPAGALRRILVETAVYHRLASEWIAGERPDLAVVYFQGSDAIGHVFAPYAPPRLPEVSEKDFARYSGVPRAYFAYLDRLLGDYRRLAERQGAVLMLASDHGFRWQDRPRDLASAAAATAGLWHRNDGIWLLAGPGIAPAPGRERAGVAQVCSTLLALLGLPPGVGLAGPPLPGIAAGTARPVDWSLAVTKWKETASATLTTTAPAATTTTPDTGEDLAKLQALGYLGRNEPRRAPSRPAGGDPTRTPGSYNNAGLLLREAGRLDEAARAYETALALEPGEASALWNLSDLLEASGKDPARADDLLLQALRAGLPQGSERLLTRAASRRAANAPAAALALLDGGVAVRPDEPRLRLMRGRYQVEAGDCRGALGDFERAETLTPTDPIAWGTTALARLCLGDREGAVRDLRRSLALDPDQPQVKQTLAALE